MIKVQAIRIQGYRSSCLTSRGYLVISGDYALDWSGDPLKTTLHEDDFCYINGQNNYACIQHDSLPALRMSLPR